MTTYIVGNCDLPDGQYHGNWGGYLVSVEFGGKVHKFKTNVGVRGMNIACIVKVSGGQATVETN